MLGLPWHPGDDTIVTHLGVNLSTKKQKIRLGKELTLETIGLIDDVPLTRRIMASQIYALYDPLGLLSPITLRYKLLLQQLVLSGLEWDAPLTPDLDKAARATLREIVRAQDIVFHRSMVPEGAQGKPELVCYWDGGKPASAGCVYVRYKVGENLWEARLLASKARVTPSTDPKVSSPCNELRGLLYLVRLITALLPGMVEKTASIFIVGDSECTISVVECKDKILGAWFANRVA